METMPFEFSETVLSNFDMFLDDTFSEFSNGTETVAKTGGGGFANVDYGGLATSVVGIGTSIAGAVQSSKAKKEASKNDVERYIDSVCGKNKSKALLKKKRTAYNDCRMKAQADFTKNTVESQKRQSQASANQQKQQQLALQLAQEKAKEKQRNTYILIGVGVALVLGYLYYQRNKQA
jgi:hypothetical protein